MKFLRTTLPFIIAAALVVTIGVILWLTMDARVPVYTDADLIRDPVRSAPVRDILWQPSRRLSSPLNSETDDYEPRMSADGLTIYFVRGKPGDNADIYTAMRTPDGWTTPEPFDIVNSNADDLGPEPSPDGESLFFYSNRAGGLGGYDLWVASKSTNGEWLPPVNLGPRISARLKVMSQISIKERLL